MPPPPLSLYLYPPFVGPLDRSGEVSNGCFLHDVGERKLTQAVARLRVYEVDPCGR